MHAHLLALPVRVVVVQHVRAHLLALFLDQMGLAPLQLEDSALTMAEKGASACPRTAKGRATAIGARSMNCRNGGRKQHALFTRRFAFLPFRPS